MNLSLAPAVPSATPASRLYPVPSGNLPVGYTSYPNIAGNLVFPVYDPILSPLRTFLLQKPSSYQHLTDQQLLSLFYETKDLVLLGHLLQRYTLLLFGVCFKYLKDEEAAKDSVQQIFLKALQEIPKYEVTYLKSWLYMVARNHCLMYLRDHHKQVPGALEALPELVAPDETDQERRQEKERLLQHIEEALQYLNEEQRVCITQFYLHRKSYQQICEATGFSLLQVKSFIQNGKRNIKLWVEKKRAAQRR